MQFVCHSYVNRTYSYVIRMPLVCTRMFFVCHPYVTCIYSYVIRMSLVCTCMSSVCHSSVLVCHPYVTLMYSYVIHMLLVCTHMSSVCHSYILVCHQHVTRMWFYHEPLKSLLKEKMLSLIKYMGLLRLQKKRILKIKVVREVFPLDILKKKKYQMTFSVSIFL